MQTLSSIQLNARLRGRGWFTNFPELCDALIPWPALFVERVQNPKLSAFLKRKGLIEPQHAKFYRPSKAWRTRHGWSHDEVTTAQHQAGRAHLRPLRDNLEAAQFIAQHKAKHR